MMMMVTFHERTTIHNSSLSLLHFPFTRPLPYDNNFSIFAKLHFPIICDNNK